MAQVVSSLGDWIGLVAILSLAARIGGSSPEAAIGIVMSARMVPGFFFGSVAMIPLLKTGFIPPDDNSQTQVYLSLPPGATLAQTMAMAEETRQRVMAVEHVKSVYTTVGGGSTHAWCSVYLPDSETGRFRGRVAHVGRDVDAVPVGGPRRRLVAGRPGVGIARTGRRVQFPRWHRIRHR